MKSSLITRAGGIVLLVLVVLCMYSKVAAYDVLEDLKKRKECLQHGTDNCAAVTCPKDETCKKVGIGDLAVCNCKKNKKASAESLFTEEEVETDDQSLLRVLRGL